MVCALRIFNSNLSSLANDTRAVQRGLQLTVGSCSEGLFGLSLNGARRNGVKQVKLSEMKKLHSAVNEPTPCAT